MARSGFAAGSGAVGADSPRRRDRIACGELARLRRAAVGAAAAVSAPRASCATMRGLPAPGRRAARRRRSASTAPVPSSPARWSAPSAWFRWTGWPKVSPSACSKSRARALRGSAARATGARPSAPSSGSAPTIRNARQRRNGCCCGWVGGSPAKGAELVVFGAALDESGADGDRGDVRDRSRRARRLRRARREIMRLTALLAPDRGGGYGDMSRRRRPRSGCGKAYFDWSFGAFRGGMGRPFARSQDLR